MFKPIRDVIVVKKAETAEKTRGGLFIPSTVDNRTVFHGLVVAAGDGVLTESGNIVELKVKQNDKVIFGKSGCMDIQVDGEDFVMMRENNILGIEQ